MIFYIIYYNSLILLYYAKYNRNVGLLEFITVLVTMSLIVLKVLGMSDYSWFKTLLPSIGFLIVFLLQTIHLCFFYRRKDNERFSSESKKK